jgi:hypothetical protein
MVIAFTSPGAVRARCASSVPPPPRPTPDISLWSGLTFGTPRRDPFAAPKRERSEWTAAAPSRDNELLGEA